MHYSHLRNLLVWLVAVPWLAGVQEPSTASPPKRELAYSGEPGERPLLLHGVPDVTITIMLDSSVKREEVRSPPGVDVRPHPFRDGILVTPAATVEAVTAVPFAVPLSDGIILNFAVAPVRGTGDTLVYVRRMQRVPQREAPTRREGELGAALAPAVDAATGHGARCTLVAADEESRNARLTRCQRVGEHAYVRIESRCLDATVSLPGSSQTSASIVFEETKCTGGPLPTCTTRLVLRKANERAGAVTVELRGRDGAVCESFSLQAW